MDGSEDKLIRRVDKMESVQTVTVFCEEIDCIYNCERVCSSTRIAIIGGKCMTKKCTGELPEKSKKVSKKKKNE